jgi:hypothetical protein
MRPIIAPRVVACVEDAVDPELPIIQAPIGSRHRLGR